MARTLSLFRDSLRERDRFRGRSRDPAQDIAAAIATISKALCFTTRGPHRLFNEQFRGHLPRPRRMSSGRALLLMSCWTRWCRANSYLGSQSPQDWVAERKDGASIRGALPNIAMRPLYPHQRAPHSWRARVAVYSDITELRGTISNSSMRANCRSRQSDQEQFLPI